MKRPPKTNGSRRSRSTSELFHKAFSIFHGKIFALIICSDFGLRYESALEFSDRAICIKFFITPNTNANILGRGNVNMTFRPLKTITPFQSAAFWITIIGISNHVIILPVLLDVAGRDAWIGVLLSFPPMLLWCGLLWRITSKINESLLSWIKKRTNTGLMLSVALIYTAYFIVITSFRVKDTLIWTQASYLPFTPIWFTGAFLFVISYLTARKGIATIAITNGILLPIIIICGLYVMTVNFQVKDYRYLLPVGTHSLSEIGSAMFISAASISGMIFIVFLRDEVKGELKKRHYFVPLLLLIELTIGPLIGAIAAFGPVEAAKMRYPAFEQWRMASVGNVIAQTDFISIFQWLSGIFITLSLALFILRKFWGEKSLPYFAMGIFIASCSPGFIMDVGEVEIFIYRSAFVLNMAFTIFLFFLCSMKQRR